MIATSSIKQIREHRWQQPSRTWGLVPTMGFMHEGHLSLIRRAKAENARIAVSIYVNPTQFAPSEDLTSYPRDLDRDLGLLELEGVDLVFIPGNQEIYPADFQTEIKVTQLSGFLEGKSRPTHFQGVTTVVAKLFNIFQPTRAYFGQKDAQQAIILHQMVRDLNFNLEIVVCPIVREPDGLAMSSRNFRLDPEQRAASTVLYKALGRAVEEIEDGERDGDRIRQRMREMVSGERLAQLDYVSAADPDTLFELDEIGNRVLLSLAVFFGSVRLIDNAVWPPTSPLIK